MNNKTFRYSSLFIWALITVMFLMALYLFIRSGGPLLSWGGLTMLILLCLVTNGLREQWTLWRGRNAPPPPPVP